MKQRSAASSPVRPRRASCIARFSAARGSELVATGEGPQRLLEALVWPNVVGKRCLVVGDHREEVRAALEGRGAARVEAVVDSEPFDLTVGWAVASASVSPLGALREVRAATRGLFVSIEPVDVMLTVAARPVPLLRFVGGKQQYSMNGRAHHRLLTAAGFTVERPSEIVAVAGGDDAPRGLLPTVLARLLAGPGRGIPHRALVARAEP